MRKAGLDVIAFVYSESGCDWSEGEYTADLQTIGVFSTEYIDDFTESVDAWVSGQGDILGHECTYRLLMRHVYEHDTGGATVGRYFEVVDVTLQEW